MGQGTADLLFDLANIAAVIGGILVVIGTAGIFWVGAIREQLADKRLVAAEAETARALESAGKANEAAAKSQEANTKLQIELERERAERLKIEQRLAPRRITADDRSSIVAALRAFANHPVDLAMSHNNAEGAQFARQIVEALLDSGWTEGSIDMNTDFGVDYPDGVTVAIASNDLKAPPPLAFPLMRLFQRLGFASKQGGMNLDSAQPGRVKIAVGFKPGRDG